MGIIFRNGIPYGETKEDVTTVDSYGDLLNLQDLQGNHLYVVKSTDTLYRYDINGQIFHQVSKTPAIIASNNKILVGNGDNWAKGNNLDFNIVELNNGEIAIGTYEDSVPLIFGTFNQPVGQDQPTLKNGIKISDAATATLSDNAIIEVIDNSEVNFQDGISIYAKYNLNDEPSIEIVDKNENDRIEFTFDQLKAIKALLDQPKLMQLTESEYDSLEYKDPNTVYVVGEDSEPNSGEG